MGKILICGLPGSGKSTLAQALLAKLSDRAEWLNADKVREEANDWDFSPEGRVRQMCRMKGLAMASDKEFVLCDFVAPTKAIRADFAPDYVIWLDTIEASQYEDTNAMFEPPPTYDFRITTFDAEFWASYIYNYLVLNRRRPTFNPRSETVQMLGRWQPWHAGHRALFERAIVKTGQVVIMVRDCQGWNDSNPFDPYQIAERIRRDLDPLYQGMYAILLVPNIVNITYGRDVGYKIEQETFSEDITKISATSIRKEMGLDA